MDKIEIGIASDYAVLETEKFYFYYGYERTINDDEWCFTVQQTKTKHEVCRFATSYLIEMCPDLKRHDEPFLFLAVGMNLYLQGKLIG